MSNNALLGTRHKWRVPRTLTLADEMKTHDIALMLLVLIALCSTSYAETNITITGILMGPSNAVVVRWPSETGRWYRLEQTTNLRTGSFDTVYPSTDATSPTNLYTNTTSLSGACFYRVIGDTADSNRTDYGTSGDDFLAAFGTTNRDRIVQFGYDGDDSQYVNGNERDDWIEQYGGDGADTMTTEGGSGNDCIFQEGDTGPDNMSATGADGDDTIRQQGDAGDDILYVSAGSGSDLVIQDGGNGSDVLVTHTQDGDDMVYEYGGVGSDSFTNTVSAGFDIVVIDGGPDSDTATIFANNQSFVLKDAAGNVLYQTGTVATVITVIDVEHGQVKAPDETILYSW